MSKQEKLAHTIVKNILKAYPIIESMETHEDSHRAIINLHLGGFKRGKTTVYTFPYKEEKDG